MPVEVVVHVPCSHLGRTRVPLVVLLQRAGGDLHPHPQGEGGLGGVARACFAIWKKGKGGKDAMTMVSIRARERGLGERCATQRTKTKRASSCDDERKDDFVFDACVIFNEGSHTWSSLATGGACVGVNHGGVAAVDGSLHVVRVRGVEDGLPLRGCLTAQGGKGKGKRGA